MNARDSLNARPDPLEIDNTEKQRKLQEESSSPESQVTLDVEEDPRCWKSSKKCTQFDHHNLSHSSGLAADPSI